MKAEIIMHCVLLLITSVMMIIIGLCNSRKSHCCIYDAVGLNKL